MLEPGRAGAHPGARQGGRVPHVRREAFRLGAEGNRDVGQRLDVGDEPGLGAVGQITIRQHHDRHHVLDGDTNRLVGDVEAVAGRAGRDDDDGALAVAPVERLHQVGLLGLGGETGAGTAALDVEDHQGKLRHHREPDAFTLQRDAGAAGSRDADGAAKGRADRGGDGGDLVLGLEGPHPPALVQSQFLENARGRRDRIGAEDDGDLGPLRRGEKTPGEGAIARHAAIDPRRHLGRLDAVVLREHLRRLPEGVPRLEDPDIGLDERGILREALLDGVERGIERPRVDPGDEPEREEVLAALLLLGVHGQVFERLLRHGADVHLVQPELLGETRLVEGVLRLALGVFRIAGLFQVALVEGRRVDDEDAALLEIAQVHLEGGRIHGHQRVEMIARRVDPLAAELELEA